MNDILNYPEINLFSVASGTEVRDFCRKHRVFLNFYVNTIKEEILRLEVE